MSRGLALAARTALLLTWLISAPTALALSVTLGERDFDDATVLSIPTFELAAAGEPSPFDSFKGDDSGENFSASWTFSYEPLAVTSASLVLGLYDDDSHRPNDQVASLSLDGVDLTSLLNAALESRITQSAGIYNLRSRAAGVRAPGALRWAGRLLARAPGGLQLPAPQRRWPRLRDARDRARARYGAARGTGPRRSGREPQARHPRRLLARVTAAARARRHARRCADSPRLAAPSVPRAPRSACATWTPARLRRWSSRRP